MKGMNMYELLYEFLLYFNSALVSWCIIALIIASVSDHRKRKRREQRRKCYLQVERIPESNGYRIKTR